MSFNRYRPYSNQRNRSKGNMRAANQQRDVCNVTLRKELDVSCGQNLEAVDTYYYTEDSDNNLDETKIKVVNKGCVFVNIFDVIRESDYFENFSNLYDQIKINAIKVDITAVDWPQATQNTGNRNEGYIYPKSLSVVTAWDRSGLGPDQVQFVYSAPNVPYPEYGVDDEGDNISGQVSTIEKFFYCNVGNNISTYSSALIRHLGPGSNLRITRFLYPENLNEKSQYVAVNLLKKQYVFDSSDISFDMFDIIYEDRTDLRRRRYEEFVWNTSLPTNPLRDPTVPFKPTFLINVITANGPKVNFKNGELSFSDRLRPCVFNLDFSIDVTFRGMRYDKLIK